MRFEKIFNLVTPLTLVAAMALFISIAGLIEGKDGGHENYAAILFVMGLPIVLISLLFHFGVQWLFQKSAIKIWVAEAALLLIAYLLVYYKW